MPYAANYAIKYAIKYFVLQPNVRFVRFVLQIVDLKKNFSPFLSYVKKKLYFCGAFNAPLTRNVRRRKE